MTMAPRTFGLLIFAVGGVAIGIGLSRLMFDHDATGAFVWVCVGVAWTVLWLGFRARVLRARSAAEAVDPNAT